jgi:hypothetical protein
VLLVMEKNNMMDISAAQSQLSDLQDEYSECKKVDTSKYTLIEVRKTPAAFIPCTNSNASETLRKT